MIVGYDLFNIITIIIIINTLYSNFEIIIASILTTRIKTIKKIKSII